jgi:inosine/xanthosine triphosphate pyrophosphatase family protein
MDDEKNNTKLLEMDDGRRQRAVFECVIVIAVPRGPAGS